MRTNVLAVATALCMFAATAAEAQTARGPATAQLVYPATWHPVASPHHAATAAESYARGGADVVRAWGLHNLLTSQAMVNLAEARHREIENRVAQTQAFFQMRDINRSYRQRELAARSARNSVKRDTRAARKGEESKPEIVALRDGRIPWPKALQNDTFESHRSVLEQMALRQVTSGAVSDSDCSTLAHARRAMVVELRKRIHEYSPQDYVDAKRFLTNLSLRPGA